MKDIVIVKSKTINNESIPVTIDVIEPFTGEKEEREITRSVIFNDFQAEVSLKIAKTLVKMNPNEFSIVGAKGELSTKIAKRIVRVANEKAEGFKCPICGSEAKSKAGLTSHIRYNHPDQWEGKKTVKTETQE
jgi:hypothetical protein